VSGSVEISAYFAGASPLSKASLIAHAREALKTGLRKEIALKVSDIGFEKPLIFRRSFNALDSRTYLTLIVHDQGLGMEDP